MLFNGMGWTLSEVVVLCSGERVDVKLVSR